MKKNKIYEDHYKTGLHIITDCSLDELIKYLERCGYIFEDTNESLGKYLTFKDGIRVIWINKKVKRKDFLPTISHELLHYVLDVLDSRGVLIEQRNDEVITYFYESVFTKVLKLYKDKKFFKKK